MILSQIDAIHEKQKSSMPPAFMLHCWQCSDGLAEMKTEAIAGSYLCSGCDAVTDYQDGIWRALAPARLAYFQRFIAEYAGIRAAEGRGSTDAAYYLNLPYKDTTGCNSAQWRIRARTFETLAHLVVAPLAERCNRPLRVLDLGAGNGWLSYRLALAGHLPVAVDLSTNGQDGLGAASNYSSHIGHLFPRVQAELDRLPFAASNFDLAIFNASFHYSESYEQTLREAMRCVCPGGSVVIADTPWYADEASGRKMVDEKHEKFTAAYGFRSNSIASLEFITPNRLDELQRTFDLQWRCIRPTYGFRWAMRPVVAKLKRRRTPSQFRIYEARVKA